MEIPNLRFYVNQISLFRIKLFRSNAITRLYRELITFQSVSLDMSVQKENSGTSITDIIIGLSDEVRNPRINFLTNGIPSPYMKKFWNRDNILIQDIFIFNDKPRVISSFSHYLKKGRGDLFCPAAGIVWGRYRFSVW